MKLLLTTIALISVFAVPVAEAGSYTGSLDGTASITARTATTVTIFYQQTAGPIVKIQFMHYCDAGTEFAGYEFANFTGSGTATFNIGPRKYQGQLLTPTHCWGMATYKTPSSTVTTFAYIDTLPS